MTFLLTSASHCFLAFLFIAKGPPPSTSQTLWKFYRQPLCSLALMGGWLREGEQRRGGGFLLPTPPVPSRERPAPDTGPASGHAEGWSRACWVSEPGHRCWSFPRSFPKEPSQQVAARSLHILCFRDQGNTRTTSTILPEPGQKASISGE